ncbi:hypothetical protein GDO81_012455 [Engystomops pustulosus]|uniref:C2H2-type domain-containing protein n=1 Tax=Engystomops pustulosus TaxID=76066 RepID=A0AAV7BM83_ENGPU|nr:hypothetical protein GDO81_012455 [Engystomops pustulosus]
MRHVQEMSAGTAASPDDSKLLIGSTGTMHCRKTVPNTTHFRTIAPKVAPKIISSYSSSTYPPALPDVALPGAKPLVISPQNYTLMKVAGQDGSFSFVALPQVTSPIGGSVVQTPGIPLQENLKLPIPRYQPAHNKKFLDKKTKGGCKPKTEVSNMQVKPEEPSEAAGNVHPKPLTLVEWTGLESRLIPGEVCEVSTSTFPGIEKSLNPTFCTPIKLNADLDKTTVSSDSGTLVRYESTKVVDSTKPMTVLSPVVFSSPLHLLQSVPKGKLPILPYSKIKKSIALENNATKPKLDQTGASLEPSQVHVTPPAVGVVKESPCHPMVTSELGILAKQNSVLGRKRGKKRRSYSDMLGYQSKLRLVGNKLVLCKDKGKAQAVIGGKSVVPLKKYRNIMPKPVVEFETFTSLGVSNTLLQTSTESNLRHRLFGGRFHRWRQGDHSLLAQRSTTKLCYKCHVCDHSFQYKHHLQDHLNGHSNKRPYHCRLCRKSYVHSGSLSTHMKLHHSESRLKKLMCCEFCAKVFGHIRVYFGHLKEVHRVIISTESSCRQLEKKNLTLKGKPEDRLLPQRSYVDDPIPGPTDEIKLQIRCGRCHFIAPTFSDMKLHLFSVHGDESQEVLPEGVLESRQGAQEEVVKQATHHWRLLSEKRNRARSRKWEQVPDSNEEEPGGTSETDASESIPSGEREEDPSQSGTDPSKIKFFYRSHFNCLLCAHTLLTQKEVMEHWERKHNCENPMLLWTLFSSLLENDQKIT